MNLNNYIYNTFIIIITFITFSTFNSCSRDKKDTELFFIQGNVAYQKGDYEKAVDFYTEAIEKTPTFADAYNNRGTTKLALEDIHGAIIDFEKAVSLDSKFILAKYNLADALSNTDKLDESLELLKTIESTYKDSSFYFVTMSNAFIRKNNFQEANNALQKAITLDKKNDKAYTNLGFIQYLQKEYNNAKSNFELAIQLNPKQDFALNNLSLIYANQNDFTKAIELVDKALSIKKDVLYENNKGYYLLNTNKLEEGRKLIDQALQKDKDNAWAVRNIGVYELLKDNSVKAIEYFIKSEKLDPTVELVNFYLGLAYNKSGNKQKACDYWKVGQQLNETKSIEKLREVCK